MVVPIFQNIEDFNLDEIESQLATIICEEDSLSTSLLVYSRASFNSSSEHRAVEIFPPFHSITSFRLD